MPFYGHWNYCISDIQELAGIELMFGWRLRPTWAAYNRFLLPRGRADVDFTGKMDVQQLKLAERRWICREKFSRRQYGHTESSPSLRPYVVGNWVMVKLPSAPKGCCARSCPLRVEKCLGQWRYILSDGLIYNALRMSSQSLQFLMPYLKTILKIYLSLRRFQSLQGDQHDRRKFPID